MDGADVGGRHDPPRPLAAGLQNGNSRQDMRFRILGPLDVEAEGRAVALGGAKPRAVLAVLLLHANEPVSAERLALALWGEDAPAGAVKTVQVHVSRLRKALAEPDVLTSTATAYTLRVRPGELDAHEFERLVAEGREALAAGDAERAAATLREALALWRGPPLDELASLPFAPPEIQRLEEQRLAALEARVEADLAAGRHAELVGELQRLTSRHPWRERLQRDLMLALYRCGRQAEALAVYRDTRRLLVDELGIEPSGELRRLEAQMLDHDPALEPPAAAAVAAAPPEPAAPSRRLVSVVVAELVRSPAAQLDPESLYAVLDRARRRSSATGASWRRRSATRSSASSASPRPMRTTRGARCAPRSSCVTPSISSWDRRQYGRAVRRRRPRTVRHGRRDQRARGACRRQPAPARSCSAR